MILFTIIFFAMVMVVGLSAVVGFSYYLKRQTRRLQSENQNRLEEPLPYRPLFAPSEEEIRASESAEKTEIEAKKAEKARQIAEQKAKRAYEFLEFWRSEPNRQNTIELFRLAVESGSAKVFSEAAEVVIRFYRENRIVNLSPPGLADLLDSHLRILPQQERTSGTVFWIKQEIANLRSKSEEIRKSEKSSD